MLSTSRGKLALCVLTAIAAVVGVLVVLATILRPSGIWIVWTVVQVPIAAVFGVLAWTGWFAVRRRLESRHNPNSELISAAVGAVVLCLSLVLYWSGTSLGLATALHAVAVPLATIVTFLILRGARKAPNSRSASKPEFSEGLLDDRGESR